MFIVCINKFSFTYRTVCAQRIPLSRTGTMNIYKTLNGIRTHLITWDNPFDCNGRDVILCITGNPGIADFYTEFGSELFKHNNVPVCIVGHAGHEKVHDKQSNTLKKDEDLFNLEGQKLHKLKLVDEIDKRSRLHLIGHSIGAWMVLEMLQADEQLRERTLSVNLLFPTIQKMAISRNGKLLNNVIRRITTIAILFFWFLDSLPKIIKEFLIKVYLSVNSLPEYYVERVSKYINGNVCENVLHLAFDEMDRVVHLNTNAIDSVKHITNVIYSSHDGWAPVHYMDDLRQFQPQLTMKEVAYNHTFVLKSSVPVAEMVSEFIKKQLVHKVK